MLALEVVKRIKRPQSTALIDNQINQPLALETFRAKGSTKKAGTARDRGGLGGRDHPDVVGSGRPNI